MLKCVSKSHLEIYREQFFLLSVENEKEETP